MMFVVQKYVFPHVLLLILLNIAYAHPGGTDSLGCHTCRTNCEETYGIPYDFYHIHNPVRACEEPEPPPPTNTSPEPDITEVERVIDGDTIVLINDERVRLIGIDTPEQGECYYKEAADQLAELLAGKEITLGTDISNRDRYNRLLRYIYADNLFINEEMVKLGYAKAYRYEPDVRFADEFQEAEDMAKEENRGLWVDCYSAPVIEDEPVVQDEPAPVVQDDPVIQDEPSVTQIMEEEEIEQSTPPEEQDEEQEIGQSVSHTQKPQFKGSEIIELTQAAGKKPSSAVSGQAFLDAAQQPILPSDSIQKEQGINLRFHATVLFVIIVIALVIYYWSAKRKRTHAPSRRGRHNG